MMPWAGRDVVRLLSGRQHEDALTFRKLIRRFCVGPRRMRMRVLFTTLPGAGPFHPLVPLAQTLQAAGHEVAFACARSYCPTVEATGFRCFPAGFDWLLSDREPVYARVQEEVARRATPLSPLADIYARF